MSRMKVAACLCLGIVLTVLAGPATIGTEDTELRDLDVTGWDCVNQTEGTAQSQDAKERNRMKNRWPVNLSLFTVEPLDTAGFLKKVREHDSRLQSKRRGELTAAQKGELDSIRKPDCVSHRLACPGVRRTAGNDKLRQCHISRLASGDLRKPKRSRTTSRRSDANHL